MEFTSNNENLTLNNLNLIYNKFQIIPNSTKAGANLDQKVKFTAIIEFQALNSVFTSKQNFTKTTKFSHDSEISPTNEIPHTPRALLSTPKGYFWLSQSAFGRFAHTLTIASRADRIFG